MTQRTEQEDNICLYTIEELKIMKKRHGQNLSYHIFSSEEIDNEIIKRETTPQLIETAKKYLKWGYLDAYI